MRNDVRQRIARGLSMAVAAVGLVGFLTTACSNLRPDGDHMRRVESSAPIEEQYLLSVTVTPRMGGESVEMSLVINPGVQFSARFKDRIGNHLRAQGCLMLRTNGECELKGFEFHDGRTSGDGMRITGDLRLDPSRAYTSGSTSGPWYSFAIKRRSWGD